MEKLKVSEESLGLSTIATAMEKAGLVDDFAAGKLLNERVMAAIGPALGDLAFAKAIEAVSRPILDEQTLRMLERARTSEVFTTLGFTEFHRIHDWIPPSIAQQLDSCTAAVKESLAGISSAIVDKVRLLESVGGRLSSFPETQALFRGLSGIADAFAAVDWMVLQERIAKLPEGEKALEDAGYSFTKERWEIGFLVDLADAEPAEREQAVDEALLTYTRGPEFTSELMHYVDGSSASKHRYRVIERAIRAHREADYLVSIPLLFAQIEGVVSDFLMLKNCAAVLNGRLYKLDMSGSPQLDKHGKPQEFTGLHSKAGRLATVGADDEMRAVAEHLTNIVVPERNPILHGTDVAYDSAKRSTQGALLLLILCSAVHSLENAAANYSL
jgi:hypothetical protein